MKEMHLNKHLFTTAITTSLFSRIVRTEFWSRLPSREPECETTNPSPKSLSPALFMKADAASCVHVGGWVTYRPHQNVQVKRPKNALMHLHENDIRFRVRFQNADRVLVLLSIERIAHLLLQLLPFAVGGHRVDYVDEDGIKDRLRIGKQGPSTLGSARPLNVKCEESLRTPARVFAMGWK